MSISIEEMATMRISWRKSCEGVMLALMVACGTFLFVVISAKNPPLKLVKAVAYVGASAGAGCIVSEVYTTQKGAELRHSQSTIGQPVVASGDIVVECCSWWYVFMSSIGMSVYSFSRSVYLKGQISGSDAKWARDLGYVIVSISFTIWTLAIFLRPKDNERGFMVLHLQFLVFPCAAEVIAAVGSLIAGRSFSAWFAFMRVPIWCVTYMLLLKLRKRAARLPPKELSKFLCEKVLMHGSKALSPMIFFGFEFASCVTTSELEHSFCDNTRYAAMWLSAYLMIITTTHVATQTLTVREKKCIGEVMTYSRIAILDLKKRQQVRTNKLRSDEFRLRVFGASTGSTSRSPLARLAKPIAGPSRVNFGRRSRCHVPVQQPRREGGNEPAD